MSYACFWKGVRGAPLVCTAPCRLAFYAVPSTSVNRLFGRGVLLSDGKGAVEHSGRQTTCTHHCKSCMCAFASLESQLTDRAAALHLLFWRRRGVKLARARTCSGWYNNYGIISSAGHA